MTRPLTTSARIESSEAPEGCSRAKWDGMKKRPPKKGEFYLSGCPGHVVAYKAPNDLATPYFIAVPQVDPPKPVLRRWPL